MALAFELGADVTKFDRAMNKAKEIVVRRTGEMVSAVQGASGNIDTALATIGASGALGSNLKTAAGLLIKYKTAVTVATAAIAAWGVTASLAADQVEKLNEVSAGMKAADVGAGFFQTWARAAEEAGLNTTDAVAALTAAREAVRRTVDGTGQTSGNAVQDLLGEVALGKGIARGSYADFISSTNTETRIKAVTDAIRALNAEVQKGGDSRLNLTGDKLAELTFGSAKFAEPIRQAKDSMDALQAAATATGTIFSDALVARAKELDERVKAVHREMSDGLKPITNDLAVLGLDLKQGWIDIQAGITAAANAAGFLYSQLKKVDELVPRLNLGEKIAQALKDAGLAGTAESRATDLFRAGLKHPGAFSSASDAEKLRQAGLLDASKVQYSPPTIPGDGRVGPIPPRRPPPSAFAAGSDGKSKVAPTSEEIDLVERYLNQLRKSVEILDAEASSLGKTKEERTLAIEMARAEAAARERGTALTATEIQQTTELAAKKAALNKVIDDFRTKQQQLNELGNFAGSQLVDAFDSILLQGGSVNDVLKSITANLAKAAIQAAILGQGPLAGLLGLSGTGGKPGGIIGALLGGFGGGGYTPSGGAAGTGIGFYANGGNFPSGKAIIVGERGPELIMPRSSGTVIPNDVLTQGGGGGGDVQVNIINNVGAQVTTQQSSGPNGKQIQVMIEQAVVKSIATNGPIAQTLQNLYGSRRTAGKS